MANQRICSYFGNAPSEIAEKIRKDAALFQMPVKTVSLTSHVHGYLTSYAAIVVFEKEKENE